MNKILLKIAHSNWYKPLLDFSTDLSTFPINTGKINNNDTKENINAVSIKQSLRDNKIEFQSGWIDYLKVQVCANSNDTFLLNKSNGNFICTKCEFNGDWEEFQKIALNFDFDKKYKCDSSSERKASIKLSEEMRLLWMDSVPVKDLGESSFKIYTKKANLEFKQSIMEKYGIRFIDSKILHPIYDENNQIIDIIDITSKDELEVANMHDVIGWNILTEQNKCNKANYEIYITDSILNALALYQKTNIPTININSDNVSFKLLAMLEKFQKIVFWFKDNRKARDLAYRLNAKRCHLVSHRRTPYECFLANVDLCKIITNDGFPIINDNFIEFKDLKNQVYYEFKNVKTLSGVQWKRFPILNSILKGHRKGELTIFTGPTGSGKTTFLSEYSLDLAMQNVKTLWGSFEIQNHKLTKMLMTQFAGINISKNIEMFEDLAYEYSKVPISFMNFHGEEALENVLKAMASAVLVKDVNHIILDNLQFMIGTQFSTINKIEEQDKMISAFRKFATDYDCHVTLVIHPRKENADEALRIQSFYGSSKASQEADNVIILQHLKSTAEEEEKKVDLKYIEISKNRFDGQLGKMRLIFDKDRLSYANGNMQKETKKKNANDDDFDKILMNA